MICPVCRGDMLRDGNNFVCVVCGEELILKHNDAQPKWIPVTERLPDVYKHVLVNVPGMAPHPTVQEAFREKNGLWYSNGFRYEADEITHWMPLPNPPKEKEHGTVYLP